MLQPTDLKRCPRCREEKVLEGNFYRAPSQNSGWSGYCIPCLKAKAVEWQKINPEKKREADRKHNLKPERRKKTRERLDRWALENPEKAKECQRKRTASYVAAHPERIRATQKKFRQSPKGKELVRRYRQSEHGKAHHREWQRAYRKTVVAKIREVLRFTRRAYGHLAFAQDLGRLVRGWLAIVQAFNSACAFCASPGDPMSLEVEHLTPRIRGGLDDLANFAPACRSCNGSKHDKTVEEYSEYRVRVGDPPLTHTPEKIRELSERIAKEDL